MREITRDFCLRASKHYVPFTFAGSFKVLQVKKNYFSRYDLISLKFSENFRFFLTVFTEIVQKIRLMN